MKPSNPGYRDIVNRNKPDVLQRSKPISKETADLGATFRTDLSTYFTIADGTTRLLYNAETWIKARLLLETAGPVVIGWRESLGDVLSGQGRLLPTGQEIWFVMPPGQRLFIASNTVDRVAFVVERIPFGQQILHQISEVPAGIAKLLATIFRRPGVTP